MKLRPSSNTSDIKTYRYNTKIFIKNRNLSIIYRNHWLKPLRLKHSQIFQRLPLMMPKRPRYKTTVLLTSREAQAKKVMKNSMISPSRRAIPQSLSSKTSLFKKKVRTHSGRQNLKHQLVKLKLREEPREIRRLLQRLELRLLRPLLLVRNQLTLPEM